MAGSGRRDWVKLLTGGVPLVAKEGRLRSGRPDGIWKGYSADGTLDSIFSGYKWVPRRDIEPGTYRWTNSRGEVDE